MTVFELVKGNVDIIDAAQRYGIWVNRYKKALCPFHSDTHASLSFKNERFKCFSCDAGGDVIDLVSHLISSNSAIDTVKELNTAYNLGIDLDKPPNRSTVIQLVHEREKREELATWFNRASNAYSAYFRLLRGWKDIYAPREIGEQCHPLYIEACTQLDYIEYILDSVFITGSVEDRKHFYQSHGKSVQRIQKRLAQYKQNTIELEGAAA